MRHSSKYLNDDLKRMDQSSEKKEKVDLHSFFFSLRGRIENSNLIKDGVHRALLITGTNYFIASLDLPRYRRDEKMLEQTWRSLYKYFDQYGLLNNQKNNKALKADLKYFLTGRY